MTETATAPVPVNRITLALPLVASIVVTIIGGTAWGTGVFFMTQSDIRLVRSDFSAEMRAINKSISNIEQRFSRYDADHDMLIQIRSQLIQLEVSLKRFQEPGERFSRRDAVPMEGSIKTNRGDIDRIMDILLPDVKREITAIWNVLRRRVSPRGEDDALGEFPGASQFAKPRKAPAVLKIPFRTAGNPTPAASPVPRRWW